VLGRSDPRSRPITLTPTMPSAFSEQATAVDHQFVRPIDHSVVAIRQGVSTFVVEWRDITYIRSERKRTLISTKQGTFRSCGTLANIVRALSVLGLVRIHRGIAVNSSRVRRLAGHGRHRMTVTLDSGDEFLVGRQFQRLVRSRFGFSG